MTFSVDPDPPGIGPGRVTVTLTDKNGAPVEDATLEVTGTMAQEDLQLRMAMKPAATRGQYGTPFVWATGGNWTLDVKATLAGGQTTRNSFNVMVEDKMSIEMDGQQSGHQQQPPELLPNQEAAVEIVSPTDGAIFEAGQDVPVQIVTHNFNLGQEGNHWHIYVDDKPGVMIMGQMTDALLRNLEPGQHQILTRLSVGSHQELQDGATVTITVLEPGQPDVTMK